MVPVSAHPPLNLFTFFSRAIFYRIGQCLVWRFSHISGFCLPVGPFGSSDVSLSPFRSGKPALSSLAEANSDSRAALKTFRVRAKTIDQFRYIKTQPKTIDVSTRLWGITTEFVGFIPQSLEEIGLLFLVGFFIISHLTQCKNYCWLRNSTIYPEASK